MTKHVYAGCSVQVELGAATFQLHHTRPGALRAPCYCCCLGCALPLPLRLLHRLRGTRLRHGLLAARFAQLALQPPDLCSAPQQEQQAWSGWSGNSGMDSAH